MREPRLGKSNQLVVRRSRLLRTLVVFWMTLVVFMPPRAAPAQLSDETVKDGSQNTVTVDDTLLPSNELICNTLRELGTSLGWALLHEEPKEGLFIWRFKLRSDKHAPRDGIFSWYWKRESNTIAKDDHVIMAPFTLGPTWQQEFMQIAMEVRLLQADFKRRFQAIVGPLPIYGRADTVMSVDRHAKTMMELLVSKELPPVAGDELMVIADPAAILVDSTPVDTVPFGTVLLVRGFEGDRLSVRYRRPGAISRDDVVSLDKAINEFDEQLAKEPNDTRVLSARGNAWTLMNEYEKAITDHDRVIQLKPHEAIGYHRRGLAWHTKGDHSNNAEDFGAAIANYSEALRLSPNDPTIYNDRGAAYLMKKAYDLAVADFDAALRLDPDYAQVLTNRGVAWTEKGNVDKALADFGDALHLDPRDDAAFVDRARLWIQINETEKAQEDLEKAILLNPQNLNVLLPYQKGQLEITHPDKQHEGSSRPQE